MEFAPAYACQRWQSRRIQHTITARPRAHRDSLAARRASRSSASALAGEGSSHPRQATAKGSPRTACCARAAFGHRERASQRCPRAGWAGGTRKEDRAPCVRLCPAAKRAPSQRECRASTTAYALVCTACAPEFIRGGAPDRMRRSSPAPAPHQTPTKALARRAQSEGARAASCCSFLLWLRLARPAAASSPSRPRTRARSPRRRSARTHRSRRRRPATRPSPPPAHAASTRRRRGRDVTPPPGRSASVKLPRAAAVENVGPA
eukprot:6200055-Pleurochrysis_carterae.AAC.13